MSERSVDERWMEQLAARTEPAVVPAPSRVKARLYSQLVEAQAISPGLTTLSKCEEQGHHLCVFEKLVQMIPLSERIEQSNPCRVCHARVLAERVENAPIFWPNCPYVGFQNR